MKPFTSRGLLNAVESRRMGDVILLPHLPDIPNVIKAGRKWVKRQNPRTLPFPYQDWATGGEIDIFSSDIREPIQIKQWPRPFRRSFNNNRALHTVNPLAVLDTFPFTGICYLIEEGGITEEIIRVFGLHRLGDVHQLGLLHGSAVADKNPTKQQHISARYPHTRFMHVLDVRVIVELMAQRLNLSQSGMTNLIICGLTHDALTPAGGDTTKLIDPHAFDEDAHYQELLQGPDWEALKVKYDLSEDELGQIVSNEGILGKILDIADKCAYVARDAHYYLLYNKHFHLHPLNAPGLNGYDQILELVTKYPLICGMWDAVEVIDDQVVITSPQRLLRFLKLRTLLGKHLYWHPGARITEFLFSISVMKELYDKGSLTREMLLTMTDRGLTEFLGSVMGDEHINFNFSLSLQPYIELFRDEKSAQQRKAEVMQSGIKLAFIEKAPNILRTSADTFLVLHKEGKVMPLCEAYPNQVAEIEDEAVIEQPYRLLWIRDEELDPPLRNALTRARERIDNENKTQ